MRLKFIKKSQSKISHHEILFIRKFRGNIGKIKNYDYEKKITKTSKSKKYLNMIVLINSPFIYLNKICK